MIQSDPKLRDLESLQANIYISRCHDAICHNEPVHFDAINIGYCMTHLPQEAIEL
jgi:hypothetical protein